MIILKNGFVVLTLVYLGLVKCDDYYSSVEGLENLLKAEKFLVKNLEDYMKAEEFKNSYLRSFIEKVEIDLELARNDSVSYFGNPINALKILKRLLRDWTDFRKITLNTINENEHRRRHSHLNSLQIIKPELNDLTGAALGIARLQNTYKLEATHLASGILMERKLSTEMMATDCFELGLRLSEAKDFRNAASWLMEARVRLDKQLAETGNSTRPIDFLHLKDETILDHLVYAAYHKGNAKLAVLLLSEQLANDPTNTKALIDIAYYDMKLKEERLVRPRGRIQSVEPTIDELYEKTCRGELKPTPAQERLLRCHYADQGVDFCRLAPFKVEELSLDPYIAYYHEAIYDSEIDNIIASTKKELKRSGVGLEGMSSISNVRTSKNTWLSYEKHDFLYNIGQRLMDITGLSLDSAEDLQVANYGIGGHYGPHYDFGEDEQSHFGGRGNRILTAMFYINDVELGGSTAFPFLHLAVKPIRRSLVVWYNMHDSLEVDYRTKHAACPILKGSKWICNEWFHVVGQEFYRPCGLQQEGHKSIKYKNRV